MFGDQIQTLARRMPWMTVEGNHERDYPDSKDRYHNVVDSGDGCGALIQHLSSLQMYAPSSAIHFTG